MHLGLHSEWDDIENEIGKLEDTQRKMKKDKKADDPNIDAQLTMLRLKSDIVEIQIKIAGESDHMDTFYMKNWLRELSIAEKKLGLTILQGPPMPPSDEDQIRIKTLEAEIKQAELQEKESLI